MATQNFRVKNGLEVGIGVTIDGTSGIVNATKFDGNLNILGNTYYVATTGSDTNSGNNINEPYLTVAKALSVATNGDIVNVSAGTYEETCPLTVPRGVTVKGAGLRATTIRPTDATKTNDVFRLNDVTTVEDFTIRGSYFNTSADTGYSFTYAPGIAITTRSPYIQRVTVLNFGSVVSADDPYGYDTANSPPTSYIAGAGAKADGSLVAANSLEAGMLFNEVTFFTPNNKGTVLTNGARAEYLNCFHYFSSQAIVGTSGTVGIAGTANARLKFTGINTTPIANDVVKLYEGGSVVAIGTIVTYDDPYARISGKGSGTFTSAVGIGSTQDVRFYQSDGTTQTGIASAISLADYTMFGAEMRSVGCAIEYGVEGVVADGVGVQLRLFATNFNHVGSGKDFSNDPTTVVQSNEVLESNGGQVSYVSIDQSGDFRVGDSLYINQQTGQVSFASTTYDLENIGNFSVTDGVSNQTLITPTSLTVGNLQLAANTFSSTSGDINIDPSGSNATNVSGDLNVSGILTASVIQVSALQKGDTSVALDDTGSDGTIRLNTDGSEALRITNTQRVGINSTAPTATLDVDGTLSVSGITTITNDLELTRGSANASLTRKLVVGGARNNGSDFATLQFKNYDSNHGAVDYVAAEIKGSVPTAANNGGELVFLTAADGATSQTERLRITSAGNVGIGTNNPNRLLTLKSTTPIIGLTDYDSGGEFYIQNSSGSGILNADYFRILTNSSSEVVRISSTGFVGIGTDTPNERLEVSANAQHRISVRATDPTMSDGSDYGGFSFYTNDISNPNRKNWDIYQRATGSTGNTELTIDSYQTDNIVRITSSGDVGIGTDDPSEILNVYSTGQTRVLIEGDGVATSAASLILQSNDAVSNFRGLGVFYYDTQSDVEWFSGRPYQTSDAFSIHRKTSVTTAGDTTANKDNLLFIINSDGNVGIGTDDPSELLHLEKDTYHGILLKRTGASPSECEIRNSGNTLQLINNTNGIDLQVGLGATQTSAVRIERNGNVGIGTDDPGERLDVYESGTAALFRDHQYSVSVYTVTPRIRFGTPTFPDGFMDFGAYNSINNLDTQTRDFKLFSYYVDPILYIKNDTGNIGIGTTNPGSTLSVGGTITELYSGQYWNVVSQADIGSDPDQIPLNQYLGELAFLDDHHPNGLRRDGGGSDDVVVDSSGNVGINSTSPTEKLDVIGTVKATDFNTTSDQNLKTNIQTIEDPLAKIVQIRGVNFEWKENNKPSAGVIAQEVEKVLPQLVTDNGTKTVNYNGLIGLLVEAVKAQQEEINELKRRIG